MSLQKQVITIDFGFGGLDQKTDEKRLPPTKLTTANNVRFRKLGRVDPRYGNDTISSLTTGSGTRLVSNNNAIMAISRRGYGVLLNDNTVQMSVTPAFPVPFGQVVATNPPTSFFPYSSTTNLGAGWAVAESNNYQCRVFAYSATSLAVEMVSKTTGELAYSRTVSSTLQSKPILVSDPRGNDSFVFAVSTTATSATGTVSYFVVTPTTTAVTVVGLSTTAWNTCEFDMVACADATYGACIYTAVATGSGSNGILLTRARWPASDGSGTALSNTTITTGNVAITTTRVCLADFVNRSVSLVNEPVRVVWYNQNSVNGNVHTAALSEALAYRESITTVTTLTAAPNHLVACNSVTNANGIGNSRIFIEMAGSATYQQYVELWGVGGGNGAESSITGHCLASRAAAVSNETATDVYLWTCTDIPNEPTNFLMRFNPLTSGAQLYSGARPVARAFHTSAFGRVERTATRLPPLYSVASTSLTGTSRITTEMLATVIAADPLSTTARPEFLLFTVDARQDAGWLFAQSRNAALVVGGYLGSWMGDQSCPPAGPQLFPYVVSAAGVYNAAGSMTTGTYQLTAIYESIDKAGRIGRSAPVPPTTVTLSGTHNQISLTLMTYPLRDGLDVRTVFYRTLSGGTVFYRCATLAPQTSYGTTVNVTAGLADATISAYEPLYITGGVLENWQPSSPIAIATNGRRVLAVPGDRPDFVMEGKALDRLTSPTFFEEVGRTISAYGRRIYALASYADKWFAFKEGAIFAATGDGADGTGQNDTLSEFEPIVTGVGCTEPRSVLETSAGVVAKTTDGFYLIGPDLSPVRIGADVEDYNTQTVLDAAYNSATDECYFAMSGGNTLVLTLFATKDATDFRWHVDPSQSATDIAVGSGKRYMVIGSSLYRESTSYVDANASSTVVSPVLETSWIPLGSLQGFGRAYKATFLGTLPVAQTSVTVTVAVAWDFNDTAYSQTFSIAAANMTRTGTTVQFEVPFSRQKGEALRFRVTQDVSTSNTTLQCMSFNQIQLVVGVKSTDNKLAPTARAGKV